MLNNLSSSRNYWCLFIVSAFMATMLRLYFASLGHNYDVESYIIVQQLVEEGKSVYANTHRYNYGPIWFYILYLLHNVTQIVGFDSAEAFHCTISLFLSVVDILLAFSIAKFYNRIGAIVFLFNPISILITGYHAQFDNLAILAGFVGVILLKHAEDNNELHAYRYSVWLAALFIGVSLIVKHLLFLFPAWILLNKNYSFRARIILCVIPVLCFLISFAPWLMDVESFNGIVHNVFQYVSFIGNSFTGRILYILNYAATGGKLDDVAMAGIIKIEWFFIMFALGFVFRKQSILTLYVCYLLSLFLTSVAIANQYFAIAAFVVAIFWWHKSVWVFFLLGGLIVSANKDNIGGLPQFSYLLELSNQWSLNWIVAQLPLYFLFDTLIRNRSSKEVFLK